MFDVLIPKYAALYPSVHFELSESIRCDENGILAERTGFQRAMGNLLSNAGRHAKSQVIVAVTSGDEFVAVDVDDDGKGIPESDRERVSSSHSSDWTTARTDRELASALLWSNES